MAWRACHSFLSHLQSITSSAILALHWTILGTFTQLNHPHKRDGSSGLAKGRSLDPVPLHSYILQNKFSFMMWALAQVIYCLHVLYFDLSRFENMWTPDFLAVNTISESEKAVCVDKFLERALKASCFQPMRLLINWVALCGISWESLQCFWLFQVGDYSEECVSSPGKKERILPATG